MCHLHFKVEDDGKDILRSTFELKTKYRDFALQLLVIEIRFLRIVAKEFYSNFLHSVSESKLVSF